MWTIEKLRESDISKIHEIYKPFVSDSAVSFEAEMPSEVDFNQRIMGIASRFPFLVIRENGELLGYAYASTHRERVAYRWCVETSIYMAVESRGKGYGKVLYNALIEELIKRNFTLAYGIITQPNVSSVALHKSCGFTEMALHRNAGYKLGKWHDVLWMERPLNTCESDPEEPVFSETA